MRKSILVHRRACILNFQQHQQFDWNKHKRKWVVRICIMGVRTKCATKKKITFK